MSRDNSDCYYYFNASCAKGDDCSFRHCEAALGSETICLFWKSGSCIRQDCKYRHSDAPVDRSRTLCYFESQPGGCQRPQCAFRHRARKICSESGDSGSGAAAANGEAVIGTSERSKLSGSSDHTSDSTSDACDLTTDALPAAIPVEPVSFHVVDEDESDAEDEKKLRAGKQSELDDGIVVKSLEQIRMERIFKQETGPLDGHKRPSSDSKSDRSSSSSSAKRVRLIRPQAVQPVADVPVRTGSPTDHLTDLLDGECDPSATVADDSDILQEIDKIINS